MFVHAVRPSPSDDTAYLIIDPRSGSAGLIDTADPQIVRSVLAAYDCRLEWVVATGGGRRSAISLAGIAADTGARLIEENEFELGASEFVRHALPDPGASLIQGPLLLFTGIVMEAGDLPANPGARNRLIEVLNGLHARTRIYPGRGPMTTLWLEKTFNSEFW